MKCGERTALGVADVLRDHVASLKLSPEQGKAAAHIIACRTGRLGGHAFECDRCGESHHYDSRRVSVFFVASETFKHSVLTA